MTKSINVSDPADAVERFIQLMPKAELHIHMEGAVRPTTLLKLAERHGVRLPANDEAGMREFYTFRDFDHFIQVYIQINDVLKSTDDFVLITQELGEEAALHNIWYLEVILSPGPLCLRHGLTFDEIYEGYKEGARLALRDHGVRMQFTIDIVRDTEPAYQRMAAEWAATKVGDGVVGLNLGGSEARFPPEQYKELFDLARAAGLKSVPHAGEVVGPESVWGAIRVLGADRLGHGIRSIEDPELVEYLVKHQIPLEVSPTSNVHTKAVASFAEHPFRALYDAGVVVTVNSDDPPMFNTTLTQEYNVLVNEFGFTLDEVKELSVTAVEASFLPDQERIDMIADFRRSFAEIEEQLEQIQSDT